MKKSIILFFILVNISSAQIGINISLPERGGTYIDIVKENYRWNDLNNGGELDAGKVDSKGWPTVDARYVLDYRPVAEWAGSIDDPELYRLDVSDTYKCSFVGRANVNSVVDGTVQNLNYDAANNKTVFDFVVANGSKGLFILDFANTIRTSTASPNSGITEFKMLRPGYENDDNLFHQPLIDILNEINFAAIRYMVFTITNGSDPEYPNTIKWADRKLPDDAAQRSISPIGKRGGACWEHVIDLSNRTMTDAWINVPISADRDYVVELAKMFKRDLDPSLKLYVESSNEVWNTAPGFEQTVYSREQAVALGIGERENHGRRTAELSEIFAEVYGQDEINEKIRVILCSHQPMLKWWVEPMLQYIDSEFGPPSDYIYGIASQSYFSGGNRNGESVDKILDDCHASIQAQIDDKGVNEAGRMQWIQKAKDWNLKGGYFSYEGGPAHGGGSTTNVGNRILAERHERMCDLLRFNYDTAFAQLGANIAMQFTLTSAYTRYGNWGLTDDINLPFRNYKMQCIKDIVNWITNTNEELSNEFQEFSIHPNPAYDKTMVKFAIAQQSKVLLTISDNLGLHQNTLIDKSYLRGIYEMEYATVNMEPGIYFCTLQIGDKIVQTKKLLILK